MHATHLCLYNFHNRFLTLLYLLTMLMKCSSRYDLSQPSNVTSLFAPVISLSTLFIHTEYRFQPVQSFLAEHRFSFSQHPLSACTVPVTQESLYIALFSVLSISSSMLAAKAPFPLYRLVILYFFTTLFHSLALPKAISFPNHQIIFMHSNL